MQHLLDQVVIVIWQWLGCSSCQLGFMPEKAKQHEDSATRGGEKLWFPR